MKLKLVIQFHHHIYAQITTLILDLKFAALKVRHYMQMGELCSTKNQSFYLSKASVAFLCLEMAPGHTA
jgi:hypothetical protein